MLFSVWNYGNRAYDYYESGQRSGTHAPTPPRARGATSLGATPEQAAWPLPAGARLVGSGPEPRGRIATSGSEPGMNDLEPVILVGLGAAVLWWVFGRKQRA